MRLRTRQTEFVERSDAGEGIVEGHGATLLSQLHDDVHTNRPVAFAAEQENKSKAFDPNEWDAVKWMPLENCLVGLRGNGVVQIEATAEHSSNIGLIPYLALWSDQPKEYVCPEMFASFTPLRDKEYGRRAFRL